MEAGSRVFLLDEDTSATNFMVRDSFHAKGNCKEKEPITPFLERAGDLYQKAGISTILVAGSSGAFFHIADTIIQMDSYHPIDITEKTKKLCGSHILWNPLGTPAFTFPQSSRIMTSSTQTSPRPGRRTSDRPERLKIKTHGKTAFPLDTREVDLRYIEQLVDTEQTACLGLLLKYAIEHLIDGKRTLPEITEYLIEELNRKGFAFLNNGTISCGYALPRPQEIYSCFNRFRR